MRVNNISADVELQEEKKKGNAQASLHGELRRGFKDGWPVLIGVIPFALVLGAQASHKGLSLFEVPLMTGLNFAGGSEFAAIQVWTSPPHFLLIVAVTFMVNSRHILMGATLTPLLARFPKRKVLPALFLMTDESWALSYSDAYRQRGNRPPLFSMPYYLAASLSFYLMWVVFTTLGALAGPALGDVHQYGFDMAFPAVFLFLLKSMWKGMRKAIPWITSLLVAAAFYYCFAGIAYIIVGPLAGLTVAWLQGKEDA